MKWMERCIVGGPTGTKQWQECLSPIAGAVRALTSYHSHISLSWFQPHPLLSISKSVRVPVLFKARDPPSRRATVLHLSASLLVCLGVCVCVCVWECAKKPRQPVGELESGERDAGERQKASKTRRRNGSVRQLWNSSKLFAYCFSVQLWVSTPGKRQKKRGFFFFLVSFTLREILNKKGGIGSKDTIGNLRLLIWRSIQFCLIQKPLFVLAEVSVC